MSILPLLAYVVIGSPIAFLIWAVVLVLIGFVILTVLRQAGAPPVAATIVWVVIAIVLVLMLADWLVPAGGGGVVVH